MFVDTNCLLRYLLNDIPQQAQIAADLVTDGAQIYPEVIPEAVYVLTKVYRISREAVSKSLISVLDDLAVERKLQIREALMLFASTNLDYIDCLLLAGYKVNDDFMSFDKKLMNKKKLLR